MCVRYHLSSAGIVCKELLPCANDTKQNIYLYMGIFTINVPTFSHGGPNLELILSLQIFTF